MNSTSPAAPDSTEPEPSQPAPEPAVEVTAAAPAKKKPRHPLAGVLTVLTGLVALGVAALITFGSIALVRTLPATGRTHTIAVRADVQHANALVVVSTPAGAKSVQMTGQDTKFWQVDVPFGDTITVAMTVQNIDVYTAGDDDYSEAQVSCSLREGNTTLSSNTGTTTGRAASCVWHNA